jgi:hypothetical protein
MPNETSYVVVATPGKSVFASLVLTFFFGPLGMFYSTGIGAFIMITLYIVVGIPTLGLGLLILHPIAMIWGAIAVSSFNSNISGMGAIKEQQPVAAMSSYKSRITEGETIKEKQVKEVPSQIKNAGFNPKECILCGNSIDENDNHCSNCGEKLKGECPSCKTPYLMGRKFCSNCGTPISSINDKKKICPECSVQVSEKEKVCHNCGFPFYESPISSINDKIKICPECSVQVSENEKVCHNCGFPFT